MIKFARGSSDPRQTSLSHAIPTRFSRFRDYKNEQLDRKRFSLEPRPFRFRSIFEKSKNLIIPSPTLAARFQYRWRKKFRITWREYVLKNSGGTCVKRKPFRMLFMGRFSLGRGAGGGNRTRREFRRSNI